MESERKGIYRGYDVLSIINSLNIVEEVKIFKDDQLINDGFANEEDAMQYINNLKKSEDKWKK